MNYFNTHNRTPPHTRLPTLFPPPLPSFFPPVPPPPTLLQTSPATSRTYSSQTPTPPHTTNSHYWTPPCTRFTHIITPKPLPLQTHLQTYHLTYKLSLKPTRPNQSTSQPSETHHYTFFTLVIIHTTQLAHRQQGIEAQHSSYPSPQALVSTLTHLPNRASRYSV